VKKPPGYPEAAVVGVAAAAATVTPVRTASDAGMEDRPGVKAALVEVKTGALPMPPISNMDTTSS